MVEIKGKERAKEFLKLYNKKDMTYEKIGNIYGLSRMMICLELNKYFKEEMKEIKNKRGWHIGVREKAKEPEYYICKFCGKKNKSKNRYYTPKFCSKDCRSKFLKQAFK